MLRAELCATPCCPRRRPSGCGGPGHDLRQPIPRGRRHPSLLTARAASCRASTARGGGSPAESTSACERFSACTRAPRGPRAAAELGHHRRPPPSSQPPRAPSPEYFHSLPARGESTLARTVSMSWERARVTEEARAHCARGVRRGPESSAGSRTRPHLGDPVRACSRRVYRGRRRRRLCRPSWLAKVSCRLRRIMGWHHPGAMVCRAEAI